MKGGQLPGLHRLDQLRAQHMPRRIISMMKSGGASPNPGTAAALSELQRTRAVARRVGNCRDLPRRRLSAVSRVLCHQDAPARC